MAYLGTFGPRYTGNAAHQSFISYLQSGFGSAGLSVTNDDYTFERWDVKSWSLSVTPAGGAATQIPTTSYYPRSGSTGPAGVTGRLLYAGSTASITIPAGIAGNIGYIDVDVVGPPYAEWFTPWGYYPGTATKPIPSTELDAAWEVFLGNTVAKFEAAGAIGLVLAWNNISDAQATGQYTPFTSPIQSCPAVWIGKSQAPAMRSLAQTGTATATVTLEATTDPTATSQTVIATLPGTNPNEITIVNTHSDGPNWNEECGGVVLLALAEYFAQLPMSHRSRTMVFVVATGHFYEQPTCNSSAWVANHPEIIDKAVAAVTIEHLGAQEWLDNSAGVYEYTGNPISNIIICDHAGIVKLMVAALQGTGASRTAVEKRTSPSVPFYGLGDTLNAKGIPTLGCCPIPAYLLAEAPNGSISKLDMNQLYGQVQSFFKVLMAINASTAAQLA